jgi:hypothetical protein
VSAVRYEAEVVHGAPANLPDGERGLLGRQLSVIREMLASLDTLTIAGQRHVMEKVVTFVDERVRAAPLRVGHRDRTALLKLLTDARTESQRRASDPSSFKRHTESLIALLGAVG